VAQQDPREQSPPDQQLARNTLGLAEVVMAGLVQIAPAFSVAFTAALIAGLAGASVPLVFLLAMVGVLATGNSLAQLSRIWPSSGSFVTFISRALDPRVGIAIAIVALLGYVIAFAGIYVFVGSLIATEVFKSDASGVPQIITAFYGILVIVPVVVGVRVGLRAAMLLYAFEVAILIAFTVAILVQGGSDGLSTDAFTFGDSAKGVALGLSLAMLGFLGFEAPVPLAEESENPRRNVPLAVMISILFTGALFVAASYAALSAFPNADAFATDPAPFVTAAEEFISPIAGLVTALLLASVTASYLAANTETARVIFSGAREGLWPRSIAKVHPRFKTPWVAVIVFVVPSVTLGIGATAFTDIGTASGFLASYGALGVILMYGMTNVALIVLWFRERARGVRRPVFTWLVVPLLGVAVMLVPYWATFQPGQPSPYNALPWLFPLLVAVGVVYAIVLQSTRPDLAKQAGSIVMGEYLGSERSDADPVDALDFEREKMPR
jgi:amino acid transporter